MSSVRWGWGWSSNSPSQKFSEERSVLWKTFVQPNMFSLKSVSADELKLMWRCAKSSSGAGLLETRRVLACVPSTQGNPCWGGVGSFSAMAQTIWCQTPPSNSVAASRKWDVPQRLILLGLLKLIELLQPEQLPLCWGLRGTSVTVWCELKKITVHWILLLRCWGFCCCFGFVLLFGFFLTWLSAGLSQQFCL